MQVKPNRATGGEAAGWAAAEARALAAALDRLALAISNVAEQLESLRSLATPPPRRPPAGTALSSSDAMGPGRGAPARLMERGRATTPGDAGTIETAGPAGPQSTRDVALALPTLHARMGALLAALPPQALAALHRELLGPLFALEPRQRSGLYDTLEAYLACGGNVVQTARQLHTHRNTVLYRLERLQRLLGTNVRDPQARLLLHLALCASPAGCTSGSANSSILHKDCSESSGKGSVTAG